MSGPVFKKATRTAQRLKIGVSGPSGAGKTYGALALAHNLASDPSRVAVLDTENESSALYSDRWPFDILALRPPYLSAKFLEAINAAVEGGYEVLVIDSISHQWDGDGGILQRKEEVDARGGNHFSNWQPFTKEHNEFRAALLNAPLHLICTMRSKMAYSQEEGAKKQIKKVGLQPIQREGMEYEFTITFDVQMDHKASASKDRTSLFVTGLTDLAAPATAKRMLDWLAKAEPLPARSVPWSSAERDAAVELAKANNLNGADLKELITKQFGHYPPTTGAECERLVGILLGANEPAAV